MKIVAVFFNKVFLNRTIICYNKLHPIYSDFFEQIQSPYYAYFLATDRLINSTLGKVFQKYTDIIHSDAAAFSEQIYSLNKKIILECEAQARPEWMADKRLDKVIFQSKYAGRKDLIKNSKAILCYPAVSPCHINENRQPNNTVKLLTVGFGSFIKGFDISFEIFTKLKSDGFPISLTIIGAMGHDFINYPEVDKSSYDAAHFERLEEYMRNNSDLKILALARSGLYPYTYSQNHILLHFCRMETFGFSVVEAITCGLPVVSVNFKAIPEIVEHEYNGFLTDPFNWDDIENRNELIMTTQQWKSKAVLQGYEYTKRLIADPNLRREMSKNSFEKAKIFSIETRFNILRSIYKPRIECAE